MEASGVAQHKARAREAVALGVGRTDREAPPWRLGTPHQLHAASVPSGMTFRVLHPAQESYACQSNTSEANILVHLSVQDATESATPHESIAHVLGRIDAH